MNNVANGFGSYAPDKRAFGPQSIYTNSPGIHHARFKFMMNFLRYEQDNVYSDVTKLPRRYELRIPNVITCFEIIITIASFVPPLYNACVGITLFMVIFVAVSVPVV